jgi:adenylylsulfate kinase
MHTETKKRSLVKAVSWRATATVITLIVVYLFTGKLVESLAVTLVVAVLNTAAYYLHERLWNRSGWGKYSL